MLAVFGMMAVAIGLDNGVSRLLVLILFQCNAELTSFTNGSALIAKVVSFKQLILMVYSECVKSIFGLTGER